MADYEASEPAVPPFADELITDLVIDINWSKLPGEFNWENKGFARGSYPPAHRIVGIVEEELGKTEIERPDSPAS